MEPGFWSNAGKNVKKLSVGLAINSILTCFISLAGLTDETTDPSLKQELDYYFQMGLAGVLLSAGGFLSAEVYECFENTNPAP